LLYRLPETHTETGRRTVQNLALSDNGFLFDTRTGNTYSLSASGTLLLRALIEGVSTDALAERLVVAFDVDPDSAARDAEQFVLRLRDLRLLGEEVAS
jgi:PqqD family protein of HPr-rel-A system